jgi:hypothetical protein
MIEYGGEAFYINPSTDGMITVMYVNWGKL